MAEVSQGYSIHNRVHDLCVCVCVCVCVWNMFVNKHNWLKINSNSNNIMINWLID